MQIEVSPLKKIIVLLGNFGSGKTEIALNLAYEAAKTGRVELIDLDMVNTYFRLSERRREVESAGIRLVTPNYVSTNVETLSLPAEVSSAFHMDWDTVIFDAGGDPAGATALGRFHEEFSKAPQLEVYNVINLRRPMSGTAEKAIALMRDMEQSSRLRVTGLINNTHLAAETGDAELRDGYEALREISIETGIPVAYTAGTRDRLQAFLAEGHDSAYIGRPLELTIHMHRDWDTYIKKGL